MKLFHLYRREDETGVSGTGPVVEGVEFTNGWCAIRWLSGMSTVCFYQSIEDVRAIHGHGGKTELIVHDFEPAQRAPTEAQLEVFLEVLEGISELMNSVEERIVSPEEVHQAVGGLQELLLKLERQLVRRLRRRAA
ncbi:MAG: hypothetical protein NDJ89_03835 [Oligoflexia bacterium]|nr:hypothetical protein [Oligoflexia bacterium]